jgi:polysaccharide deacetylase family protein (PEP-CTERM system associated)
MKQTKIFTVDIEEFFHAENIFNSLPMKQIESFQDRVHVGTRKLLGLLAEYGAIATFFVLGCVAKKHPELIREISEAGHEIATHGYDHIPLHKHTVRTFSDDLSKSIDVLSGISGKKIRGFRATSFSLLPDMHWFFETLKNHGIVYDSSLSRSFFRKQYGSLWSDVFDPSKNSGIMEFPPSYISLGPLSLPLGGGYFRMYPYAVTRYGLNRALANRKTPPLFYVHPWELDPGQPRVHIPPLSRIRHYLGLEKTEKKIALLLSENKFVSIASYFDKLRAEKA